MFTTSLKDVFTTFNPLYEIKLENKSRENGPGSGSMTREKNYESLNDLVGGGRMFSAAADDENVVP